MELPSTRKEALERGFSRYYTGKPCKKGHIDVRFARNGNCETCHDDYKKQWYEDNKEAIRERNKQLYKDNGEAIRGRNKQWREDNREAIREYQRDRYCGNLDYRMSCIIRSMLRRVLIGDKSESTFELIGYTTDELILDIENKMLEGMTWDNYGEWHIDHIHPVSVYLKDGETDPSVINALDNLQPLWAADNLSKGASVG